MSDSKKRAAENDALQDGVLPGEKRPKTESIASAEHETATESKGRPEAGSNSIAAATVEQKENWTGWCEIDSDPAIFNVMLREFGVRGAKVQEVIGLDDELLAWINKPIYGLIFLFRYSSDIPYKGNASCPEHIWFANQTTDNLCASVALLNIVNNVPGLELGENLANFKTFTQSLTPPLRGYALSQNFEFVRRIHNSFARKQDMINVDRALARQASKKRGASRTLGDTEDSSTDPAYHFIAFVPVEGEVWMLDGMDRQPTMVGPIGDDWIDQVKPEIIERMELYQETEVNFALLAVVQDPLVRLGNQLAANIKLVSSLQSRMNEMSHDWRAFLSAAEAAAEEGCLYGPNEGFRIDEQMIKDASLSNEDLVSSSGLETLSRLWKEGVTEQAQLRGQIRAEQQQEYEDADAAEKRRFDHFPAIRAWLGYLASKPEFEQILREYEG